MGENERYGQATPRSVRDASSHVGPTSIASVTDTPIQGSSSPLTLLQPFVDFNEIYLQEKVGHGSYGVVYKAVWRNRYVAVKEFGISAETKAIETEVKQLSRVRHPNIIALYGISADQQSKYLIMEYAEGGSLHNFLHGKVKPPYSKSHAISWARQCAEGVAYLHGMKPKPLIHRDLKPLNLLLTNKGRLLKICDFGTVADKSTWMTNNKGSAAWMAPEVFEGSKYTEKCDVFSWAIVLWEVLSRQQPFKEIDNTYSIMWKIHKGERPPMIKDCPERIQNLMTSCWATTPDLRPSMKDVVDIMNELVRSYPGGDEALEYEFLNQQIVQSSESDDTLDNCKTGFSNFSVVSCTPPPTQSTSTSNATTDQSSSTTSPSSTPTASADVLKSKLNSPRWDTIPEESESASIIASEESVSGNPFCLTPTSESSRRYNTIRNGMTHLASVVMTPLSVDVDPNAWDIDSEDSTGYNPFAAKSDGRERLTVTDAKPMMPNAINSNTSGGRNNNITSDDDDDAAASDVSDNDGPDQSLHEILDPELQPEPPIPDNPESQEIYEEHRRLAKEYLRVDTKLYYAQDLKEKLLAQMNPAERQQKQELLKKMSEKEELLELYNNLKQQLEKMRSTQQLQQQPMAAAAAASTSSIQQTPRFEQSENGSSSQMDSNAFGDANAVTTVGEDWVVVAQSQAESSKT